MNTKTLAPKAARVESAKLGYCGPTKAQINRANMDKMHKIAAASKS